MLSAQVNISLGLRYNVNTTLELLVISPVLLYRTLQNFIVINNCG